MSGGLPSLPDEAKIALARATEKTVDGALDLVNRGATFLHRVVGEPLEEAGGLLTDSLKRRRLRAATGIFARGEEILLERGVTDVNQLPLAFAGRMFEAASLQEEPSLCELYARLLANSVDPTRTVDPEPTYIKIMETLSPLDAIVFNTIYATIEARGINQDDLVYTGGLPEAVSFRSERKKGEKVHTTSPSEDVAFSLWKLCNLSCLTSSAYFGGGSGVATVGQTILGRRFYKACQ